MTLTDRGGLSTSLNSTRQANLRYVDYSNGLGIAGPSALGSPWVPRPRRIAWWPTDQFPGPQADRSKQSPQYSSQVSRSVPSGSTQIPTWPSTPSSIRYSPPRRVQ